MTSTSAPDTPVETGAVVKLAEAVARGRGFLDRPDLAPGLVRIWLGQVRAQVRMLYGANSEAEGQWPLVQGTLTRDQARDRLQVSLLRAERLLKLLTEAATDSLVAPQEHRVFIGHGRSPVWRELKDFLQDRLGLPWEEFNRESVPGIATTERLEHMLKISTFAFLVMTAEDEHADQTLHARANVIHEVGLFQGRLGARRAIILLEEGCQQFSNIHGLSHIPFPAGRVGAVFEDIRRVLERECITGT